jgi:hypothetical protein
MSPFAESVVEDAALAQMQWLGGGRRLRSRRKAQAGS